MALALQTINKYFWLGSIIHRGPLYFQGHMDFKGMNHVKLIIYVLLSTLTSRYGRSPIIYALLSTLTKLQ